MSGQARVNTTSFRFSDEVREIIDSVPGKTFADRFEYLVLNYKETIEEKEQYVKSLDKQITEKRKLLNSISDKIYKYKNVSDDLISLVSSIKECNTK